MMRTDDAFKRRQAGFRQWLGCYRHLGCAADRNEPNRCRRWEELNHPGPARHLALERRPAPTSGVPQHGPRLLDEGASGSRAGTRGRDHAQRGQHGGQEAAASQGRAEGARGRARGAAEARVYPWPGDGRRFLRTCSASSISNPDCSRCSTTLGDPCASIVAHVQASELFELGIRLMDACEGAAIGRTWPSDTATAS